MSIAVVTTNLWFGKRLNQVILPYDKANHIIRLARIGGVWPISQSGAPIASVTIGSYKFDLYYGFNGAMKVYSFLPPQGTTYNTFNADIKNFFKYLVQNQGFPQSTQNLIGITTPYDYSLLFTSILIFSTT